jgi:hypothetical protein
MSLEVVVGLALMAKTESGVAGRMVDLESCLDNRCGLREQFTYQGATEYIQQHFPSAANLIWPG